MNPLIGLKKAIPPFFIVLLLVCQEVSSKTQLANPAGGAWEVVASPNTGSPNNYLFGVAAIASNDVWAVGAYGELGTTAQQLIEHWDGASWTVVASPSLPASNELLAASAVSADNVWAVGGQFRRSIPHPTLERLDLGGRAKSEPRHVQSFLWSCCNFK